jgi:mannose-6-phosphate isomerase
VLLLRGALKDYPWGRIDGLAEWTSATGAPQAELWFGAHPSGPSPIIDSAGDLTGDVCTLGDAPVLVKLLAAGEPLSVQVHPTQAIAQEQWAAQQSGAPVVYADAAEKSEVLYAVEPFRAFAGWRDNADAARLFAAIDGTDDVQSALHRGDRLAAVRAVLALDDIAAKIRQVPRAVADLDELAQGCYARVIEKYPSDVGVLITLLLETIALQSGEAIYVPAGVPHSYVDGLGIEVMTASDNVARLGLTPKPVFIEHALRALQPDRSPQVLQGEVLRTPAGFELALITGATQHLPSGQYRLALAVRGDVWVNDVQIPVGAAAVCTADEPAMEVRALGTVALVTHRNDR